MTVDDDQSAEHVVFYDDFRRWGQYWRGGVFCCSSRVLPGFPRGHLVDDSPRAAGNLTRPGAAALTIVPGYSFWGTNRLNIRGSTV